MFFNSVLFRRVKTNLLHIHYEIQTTNKTAQPIIKHKQEYSEGYVHSGGLLHIPPECPLAASSPDVGNIIFNLATDVAI
jgi:hypothetical protein